MIYLDVEDLMKVAYRVLPSMDIQDVGLLESALGRPQASAFGAEAYPDLFTKAAALVHSLTKHHALVDGNKRLVLAAFTTFIGLNGLRLTMTNDEASDFIIGIAEGTLIELGDIGARIESRTSPR